jgi:hypothetical protein
MKTASSSKRRFGFRLDEVGGLEQPATLLTLVLCILFWVNNHMLGRPEMRTADITASAILMLRPTKLLSLFTGESGDLLF